ncbi:hypothetical protein M3221_15455 [Domibacillus indicus]|uniref:hypothetical protein n=1 Tax=Domibacillus indicus TaxID=1437523 RepID=UPI00203BA142|nr:hypothetical protein [Domibacillus indicus]MCM3789789.1 hypothetical protein [Domibacillus indicus]
MRKYLGNGLRILDHNRVSKADGNDNILDRYSALYKKKRQGVRLMRKMFTRFFFGMTYFQFGMVIRHALNKKTRLFMRMIWKI